MKRCFSNLLLTASWCLSLAIGMLVVVTDASAQTVTRQFPPNVLHGVMMVAAPPEVTINGSAKRLAPGEAASEVAKSLGLNRRDLYRRALALKDAG